ncbi:hypothetical protein [Mongoliimonas terrestris]|uniref:hypothetical protein n=1 Tax=Mongoliimonas terrestris TaxID=1709001 RepID=UPI0009497DB6|nr:hypothetical protein [Mongoliimonas terrestris]
MNRTDPIQKPTTDHAEVAEARERLKEEGSLREEARRHEAEINEALDGAHVPGDDEMDTADPAEEGADRAFVPRPMI